MTTPKRYLWLAACVLFAPVGPGAQVAPAAPAALDLSLDDAVDLGLKNNLGLKTERMRLDEKKWELYADWNVFLPKINLTAAMSRSNLPDAQRILPDLTKLPAISIDTIPRWGAQFLLDLSWGLSTAQFVYVKQTSLDYAGGRLTAQIAEKRLARDVKRLYYSLLLLRESVQIFEQNLDLAQRRLDLARAREKIGAASELDVLAEEVNLESARPQVIEQRDSFENALANLKQLLGIKQDVELRLVGGLDIPAQPNDDAPTLLARARSRLDLTYLRNVVDSLKNKLSSDIAGLTPSLFVRWTFDPTFQRDPTDPSTWSGASFSDLWKQTQGALSFGVSIPLDPLLPSSRARTDIARSKLQIGEAELGYQGALEGAEIEVLTILKELDKSTRLIGASEKSVSLAERLYSAAEKAYGSGAKNYLELQDALGKLNGARFERLRDKYGYLNSLNELEFAVSAGDFASR